MEEERWGKKRVKTAREHRKKRNKMEDEEMHKSWFHFPSRTRKRISTISIVSISVRFLLPFYQKPKDVFS